VGEVGGRQRPARGAQFRDKVEHADRLDHGASL
jgi:hypothetical protein